MTFARTVTRTFRVVQLQLGLHARHRVQIPLFVRHFSDKYSSINEFNKQKKEFLFGAAVDLAKSERVNKERVVPENNGFDAPQLDLLNHPRLEGLRPNSAEYKFQMHLIQQEFQAEQEKKNARWETMERIKGMAAGMAALAAILAIYLGVMNYKYLTQLYRSKVYFDIDDSKVQDLNDPKGNLKSSENMVERLAAEMTPEFIANLQDSTTTSGVYVFGTGNGNLPLRIPGLDGKYFNDVLVAKDYLIAVDDSGKVFHYSKKLGRAVQVDLPHKVASVVISNDKFYYLSNKLNEIYVGGKVAGDAQLSSGWFRSSGASYSVETIKFADFRRGEKVKTLAAGESHLLILSSKGRVFEVITNSSPLNLGQFGLPQYSPYSDNKQFVVNTPFELTNLNNEVVALKDSKYVRPRTFTSVAAGKNFNVACDSNGNVWTWGDNSSGQCGREVNSTNDVQQVPKLAFTTQSLKNIVKFSLPDRAAEGTIYVKEAYAADLTAFLRLSYEHENDSDKNQDLIVSFGSGIKGQLGVSRYIHASSSPRVLKSLVGLTEYDEQNNSTVNVKIKDLTAGNDHVFITLDNAGSKDVLVFGENEFGQFGNGKTVKSSKPIGLPKLVEPSDLEDSSFKARRKLARKLNDQTTSRLQLLDGTVGKKPVEQVMVAGDNSSAIFYRRK